MRIEDLPDHRQAEARRLLEAVGHSALGRKLAAPLQAAVPPDLGPDSPLLPAKKKGRPKKEPRARNPHADERPLARVVLRFAWDALASDNLHMQGFAGRGTGSAMTKRRKYEASKDAIHAAALEQYPHGLMRGRLLVLAIVTPPDHRHRDPGNFRKGTLDALEGALYEDDKQVALETWTANPVNPTTAGLELLVLNLEDGAQSDPGRGLLGNQYGIAIVRCLTTLGAYGP